MSVYVVKGKGWRYDFTHKAQRYTETWFKTKTEARIAEARRKEEIRYLKAVFNFGRRKRLITVNRDKSLPWVFWHQYWSSKNGELKQGRFLDRKRIMRSLCKAAGVQYFRFHALRHSGASILDNRRVPLGSIQKILGHENRKTTEICLHSIAESEREAMAIFEQARQKSHTDSHTQMKKGPP